MENGARTQVCIACSIPHTRLESVASCRDLLGICCGIFLGAVRRGMPHAWCLARDAPRILAYLHDTRVGFCPHLCWQSAAFFSIWWYIIQTVMVPMQPVFRMITTKPPDVDDDAPTVATSAPVRRNTVYSHALSPRSLPTPSPHALSPLCAACPCLSTEDTSNSAFFTSAPGRDWYLDPHRSAREVRAGFNFYTSQTRALACTSVSRARDRRLPPGAVPEEANQSILALWTKFERGFLASRGL